MTVPIGEMLDTPIGMRRLYFERLAALSSTERLALMFSMSRMVRRMAESSIRRHHPSASPEEIRIRMAVRMYGRVTVERFLGRVPEDAR